MVVESLTQTYERYFFIRMGMLSKQIQVPSSPSVMDAFCHLLQRKLVYAPGERDMVIMHHEFGITWKDNSKVQFIKASRLRPADSTNELNFTLL
jgi:hypothetical protein